MPGVQIVIINLTKVRHDLSIDSFNQRARLAFMAGGAVLEAEARKVVQPHNWTGRFERGIHSVTTGYNMSDLSTLVGVSAGAVPEARPLTYGWPPGKFPRISGIADWVSSKLGDSNPMEAAFRIARAIAMRGFSFGKLDTFSKAFENGRGVMQITMERFFSGHTRF